MSSSGYGAPSGQRNAQQGYEAPACVQNAMMTKDKKPFTYTPGGIDLSQIKSERMAKRLARNAQAEGATGAQQHNRPTQPQSPGGTTAGPAMGAAAMGMPFQVLPPPPPPMAPGMAAGKKTNGAPAPPPPPSSNISTLAPPTNGNSAPGSPNAARKSPTPQRFEPPPMGFRPEIKIPTNPMAALRKVPPPVEKNTFWKDEYVKDRSKSPMPDENDGGNESAPHNGAGYGGEHNNNNTNYNNNNDDGFKKPTPTTSQQQPETNNYASNAYNNNNSNYNQQQQYSPPQQQQYSPPQQQQYSAPPAAPSTPPQQQSQQQFRSVAAPQSPAVNVYTRQTDSPRADTSTPPQRATESPFKFAQQQQLQQQRSPQTSPLAQQQPSTATPSPSSAGSQTAAAQSVPWRTQRAPQTSQQQQQQQSHPQPIFNNVLQLQQQQQQQRSPVLSSTPDMVSQTYGTPTQAPQQYQAPKTTSGIGTLYIAPLAPPTEPQAQNIVRQQMQQQQQRDSPMRQLPQQQQQPQQRQAPAQQPATRWMSSQAAPKEQPEWARPEENGNVVPSSLRMKSPPPPQMQQQAQQQQQQQYQQQQPQYQPLQGNGFAPSMGSNFGAQMSAPTGLRLQINLTNPSPNQGAPKERIIPIQLEQTPTYTPGQPNFNAAPTGYVIRSPNQFVDQGYNNYPAGSQQHQQQFQQQQPLQQRVMSPTQQLNAPRMIQQQQQQLSNTNGGAKLHQSTRIIPISMDGDLGTRGPISQSPIVIQNDPRTPPVQSKSFRILQKITDTTDDGSADESRATSSSKNESYVDLVSEPQLQRPTFARQMSAQQARNSPTIEQMRRMQIAHDQNQQQASQARNQGNTAAQPNRFVQQQRPAFNNDNSQQYVPPSEQQVPEPKIYTGSAIPSRSFKILQAMTTPENAGPGQSDL